VQAFTNKNGRAGARNERSSIATRARTPHAFGIKKNTLGRLYESSLNARKEQEYVIVQHQ
jgi:hypothetical protein